MSILPSADRRKWFGNLVTLRHCRHEAWDSLVGLPFSPSPEGVPYDSTEATRPPKAEAEDPSARSEALRAHVSGGGGELGGEGGPAPEDHSAAICEESSSSTGAMASDTCMSSASVASLSDSTVAALPSHRRRRLAGGGCRAQPSEDSSSMVVMSRGVGGPHSWLSTSWTSHSSVTCVLAAARREGGGRGPEGRDAAPEGLCSLRSVLWMRTLLLRQLSASSTPRSFHALSFSTLRRSSFSLNLALIIVPPAPPPPLLRRQRAYHRPPPSPAPPRLTELEIVSCWRTNINFLFSTPTFYSKCITKHHTHLTVLRNSDALIAHHGTH